MFLTPIFYPVSAIPEKYQAFIYINPLAYIVEQGRNAMIFGAHFSVTGILLATIVALFSAWVGFAWFQKTRKGFADVL
jgi:lipopolysaccharide transport system permease protein